MYRHVDLDPSHSSCTGVWMLCYCRNLSAKDAIIMLDSSNVAFVPDISYAWRGGGSAPLLVWWPRHLHGCYHQVGPTLDWSELSTPLYPRTPWHYRNWFYYYYYTKSVCRWSNGTSIRTEIRRKNWVPRVPPFKVIESNAPLNGYDP